MMEVIVAMSILAIAARIAVPHLDARRMRITAAQQLVASSLRLARAEAITKSVHYRIDFIDANQLQVAPMEQDDTGTWRIDDDHKQTVALPTNTHFASGTQCVSPCQPVIGTSIEFNSRGITTNLAALAQITLVDDFGVFKALQAWPSGQINEL